MEVITSSPYLLWFVVGGLVIIGALGLWLRARRQSVPNEDADAASSKSYAVYMDIAAIAVTSLIITALVVTQLRMPATVETTPTPDYAQTAIAAIATPSPHRSPTPRPSKTPTHTPTATQPTTIMYVVQKGDTILAIAKKYGVRPDTLVRINDLKNPERLSIGQELVIPLGGGVPMPSATAQVTITVTGTAPSLSGEIVHVVQKNETLLAIAKEYGVTVDDIMAANDLESAERLSIGQELIIRGGEIKETPTSSTETTPTALVRRGATTHIVRKGETPRSIARQYGITADALLAANDNLDPTKLQVGQELKIPAIDEELPVETPVLPVTETPEFSPTAPPSLTPTETVTATATVEGAAQLLPAPMLVDPPPDGDAFTGKGTPIMLQWTWMRPLEDDEWYDIQMWKEDGEPLGVTWTKEMSWKVDEMWFPGTYNWRVRVIRGADGEVQEVISNPSETWQFVWR